MAGGQPIKRMVVGVDGSEHGAQALDWAIQFAEPIKAEIIAVFAIAPTIYAGYNGGFGPAVVPPELDPEWRSEMKTEFEQQWCRALADSGVTYRTVMEDGRPASVIAAIADREDADLVVVGRRGRGGVTELLLGSVSHELSLHCKRPVLLISHGPSAPDGKSAQAGPAGTPTR
jgi:nucleotide-binding universal stress UspA family protein